MPTRLAALAAVLLLVALTAHAQNPGITVNVDVASNQHPIEPAIYGSSWASATEIQTLGLTLNRWGGNAMSRYNWTYSTANRCKDYFFFNIPDNAPNGGANGESADIFIDLTRNAGAQPVLTIPMLSLLPKDRSKRCSFPQSSVPNQEAFSDPNSEPIVCGNGRYPDGNPNADGPRILGNADPNNISTSYPLSHQGDWVQHLVDTYGSAAGGGVRYYSLDNEPHLWSFDHWDVHPAGTTYAEVWGKMEALGAIIRAKDSSAIITGGEEWGWSGYFDSGIDAENNNSNDRDAHGGTPWYDWMLQQAKAYADAHNGTRILDVLTVHFYPQAGEFWSGSVSTDMQNLRNRSTRSLWDPTYYEESWISDTCAPPGCNVKLIPRLKEWVANNYPGTKIGITEYNWGDVDHINIATTQADILGIFGREDLDMAVRWGTPDVSSFAGKAFRMYRNYDGAGAKFGDTSVGAVAPNVDEVSAFAALRSSDNALTVMLIAKRLTGDTPTTVSLANFNPGGAIQRWQLDAAGAIARRTDLAASANVSLTLPAQSVTLLVIPTAIASAPTLTATASSASRVVLSWTVVNGAASYDVYRDGLFLTNTAATALNDDAVVADHAYVYRVRAAGGPFSAPDAATTVVFTDSPLTAGTTIKAVHFTQMRTAVNALRTAAGLASTNFATSNVVMATHMTALRTALDEARTAIGLPPLAYTDAALAGVVVKAQHVNEIRNGVK